MYDLKGYVIAVTLQDGNVLVTGGYTGSSYIATCELHTPSADRWSPVAHMNDARGVHSIALLSNGSVIVAGGYGSINWLSSVERYDVGANTWTMIASMVQQRDRFALGLLQNNSLFACGGGNASGFVSQCEVFSVDANTWMLSSTAIEVASAGSVMLQNGSFMLAGGFEPPKESTSTVRVWTSPDTPPQGDYRCISNRCVKTGTGTGIPHEECDSSCGQLLYVCEARRCVQSNNGTGNSEKVCQRFCGVGSFEDTPLQL